MPSPAQEDEKRGLALLSLDSGRFESLSGLSQLFILREILRAYEFDNGLDSDSARAYKVFDLIGGTGSGGLVACLVGPLRLPIEEAIQVYLDIHKSVFILGEGNASVEERTTRLKTALRKLIEARLSPQEQSSRFSEFNKLVPGCMVLFTALSKTNVQYPTPFRSFRGRRGGPPPCNLLEATLSTLAQSHLFSSVTLNHGSIMHQFISADLGHCNPLGSLISDAKDQFKDDTIALIVSIGTGRPSHIRVEDGDGFARAALELAITCHDTSDRFEKMLHNHAGAFVRLNADGYEISPSLSVEDVSAHTGAYVAQTEVAEKLDLVADGLKERPGRIKVSEVSFPKVGTFETLRRDIHDIPQRASMFNSVNRLPYAERATFNPDMACYPGTRLHLLSVIYEWMKQKSYKQPILWLKGLFGTGKSALSHSVALEALSQKVLASTFFMTPGTAPRDVVGPSTPSMNMPSIDNLVSTLLRDLSGISPLFRSAIGAELEASPRLLTASPIEQLDQLFYPFLTKLQQDGIFLWVIDGFDEIIRRDREGFRGRDILESLVKHGPKLRHSNFIIFITSRPFQNHPFEQFSGHYILPLVLDLAASENAEDMDTIAYSELQTIARQRQSDFTLPLRNSTIATAFRDKASGLPLWLKIVRNFLMKSLDPNKALIDLIKPDIGPIAYRQRINETYASVITAQIDLTDPDNQRYLNHVVIVLLSLQRPVPRSVLSDLVDGAEDLPVTVIHSVLNALHPLLLGLDNNSPVEFIHLSLHDFFRDSPTFADLIQHVPAPRDFDSGHYLLLARALNILQKQLQDDQIVYEMENGSIPDVPPGRARISEALLYSAGAWTHHITQGAANRFYGFDVLDSFLAGNFAKWLEFHICFGSFLFSLEFLESVQNIHEESYMRFYSAMKLQSVADTLEKISSRLLHSHRFQEAALASSQAVLSWRLKATNSEPNSHLALSLRTLARAQLELRQPSALIASEEVVQIYYALAIEQPAVFNEDLARALNHMFVAFFEAGKTEEALEASLKSVAIYRNLADEQPAVFNGSFALALNNLSIRFTAAGKKDAAFEASQQSVELYNALAVKQPALFNTNHAIALNNLRIRFTTARTREEALEASQQSVEFYRELAAERPVVFNDDLALALNNLSAVFFETGKKEEALRTSQHSVELYCKLAAERPIVFNSALALALNNLSIFFTAVGQREGAFEASQQSVVRYRELAAQRPAVFNSSLAFALNTLSICFYDAGMNEEAFEAGQQSVELYRVLAVERPLNINTLALLSACCYSLTDGVMREDPFEVHRQSIEVYRPMAGERLLYSMAVLPCTLANLFDNPYLSNAFLEAHEESKSSLTRFRTLTTTIWDWRFAKCLAHFAKVAWSLRYHTMAMDLLEESISLYKGLADEQPWIYQSALTALLILWADWKREGSKMPLCPKPEISYGSNIEKRMSGV